MKKILSYLLCALLCASLPACGAQKQAEAPAAAPAEAATEQTGSSATEKAVSGEEAYADVTRKLIDLVEQDAELKALLEQAIAQAAAQNPDPDTNPVDSLESYYAFVDRIVHGMPWEISPSGAYSSLYERIDQGMGCLYFICDQPLEALEDRGYFHNPLLYHEPFRSWWADFIEENGNFLSTETSWNETYYRNALENPDFHLGDGTYEDASNWKSFNDFFARKLLDPSVRPIAAPEDPSVVTAPADSVPQGIWEVDANSRIDCTWEEQEGIAVKTGTLTDLTVLLQGSAYADAFACGKVTHTFLDVDDYHRYHFPVGGTVKEVLRIAQDDAPGGVIVWDAAQGRYKELYSENLGWQSIETRGIVIMEPEAGGLLAIVPVGMCQVSSVNFEDSVVPGAVVDKGDPLGYFLFGGSDIIMIFSEDAGFGLTAEPGDHLDMGQAYGTIAAQ